jgi:hypothetical protein
VFGVVFYGNTWLGIDPHPILATVGRTGAHQIAWQQEVSALLPPINMGIDVKKSMKMYQNACPR